MDMPKQGTPWYRQTTDSWYVTVNGKQVFLARGRGNRLEAFARFVELAGGSPQCTDGAAQPPGASQGCGVGAGTGPTVAELIEAFKADRAARVKPSTLASYRAVLSPLADEFGARPAREVSATAVERWAAKTTWAPTTRRYAIIVVSTIYLWAAGPGELLATNPIGSPAKPPGRSRGAEALISDDLHRKLLTVVSPEFADFITAVRATGARPGEIARLEARHFFWDAGCAILETHKTERHGRPRVIHFPAGALELCRRYAAMYPEGVLFRTTVGEPWRKTGLRQAMRRAQKKLGLPKRPLTSAYRHGFATDALAQGAPDAFVAELLGHTSTAMIHKHYGHLAAKSKVLKEPVYNIEVDGQHCYRVGQQGLLVHNASAGCDPCEDMNLMPGQVARPGIVSHQRGDDLGNTVTYYQNMTVVALLQRASGGDPTDPVRRFVNCRLYRPSAGGGVRMGNARPIGDGKDVVGHIIGRQFGGLATLESMNFFPQNARNNRAGAWGTLETRWTNITLRTTSRVCVRIRFTMWDPDAPLRPTELKVEWWLDGVQQGLRQGGPAGEITVDNPRNPNNHLAGAGYRPLEVCDPDV